MATDTTEVERVVYFEPLAGTVFDPTSETFGPIMAAIQAGDFEVAAALLLNAAPRGPVPIGEDGVPACPCGGDEWRYVERGYEQWSTAEWDESEGPGRWRVTQDGWDDMSEGGAAQCLRCEHCGAEYQLPEEVDFT